MTTGASDTSVDPWSVPAEHTRPTPEQVAESVQVWDPHGHVTSLATQESRAGETVVSLDSDILFAFGSADMPSTAGAAITDLVAAVPEGAVVQVVGHTDAVGSDADNEVLSQDARRGRGRRRREHPVRPGARGLGARRVRARGVEPRHRGPRAEPAGRDPLRRLSSRAVRRHGRSG